MKIETGTKVWAVTDARDMSEIGDVCFQTSLGELGLQVKGGLDPRLEHLTLYSDHEEAMTDARRRLAVRKVQIFLESLGETLAHLSDAEDFIPEELREELELAGLKIGDVTTEKMAAFIAAKRG